MKTLDFFYWCNNHSSMQKTLMAQVQSPSADKFFYVFNGLDRCCRFSSWPYIKWTLIKISFWMLTFFVTLVAKCWYQLLFKHKQLLEDAEISNDESLEKRQKHGVGVNLWQWSDSICRPLSRVTISQHMHRVQMWKETLPFIHTKDKGRTRTFSSVVLTVFLAHSKQSINAHWMKI